MPGIRIEGQPPQRPTGTVPPGVGPAEQQLTQAIGGDPYGGMTAGQLGGVLAGGVAFRNVVQAAMDSHAAASQAATRAGMQPTSMPGVVLGSRPRTDVVSALGGGVWGLPEALQHLRNIDLTERQILAVSAAGYNFQRTVFGQPGNVPPGVGGGGGGGGGGGLPPFPQAGVGMPPPGMGGAGGGFGGGGFGRGWGGGGAAGGGAGGGGAAGGGGGGGNPPPGGRAARYRGGGRLPFVGGVGFPNMGRMGGILPGWLGTAAGLLEEAVFAPQIIGGVEQAALGSASPYMDLVQQQYAFARAAGETGEPGLRSVFPGSYQVPPWMRALGLGPAQATQLQSRFGILGRSADEREDIMRSLGEIPYVPGFSGIGRQGQEGARQAALYGAVQPGATGIRDFTMQIAPAMETAIVRGMDRVEILRSIDAGVHMAARGGALSVSAQDQADFLMRFSNLPGGRTGEAGLQAAAGIESAMQTIGQNPLRTMMAVQAAAGIKTESDLAKLLGQEAYQKTVATPEGRALVQNFMQENRAGNTWAASQYLQALTSGNRQAQMNILTQPRFFQGLSPGMQDLTRARLMNITPAEEIALRLNPQGFRPEGDVLNQLNIGRENVGFNTAQSASYRQGLLRMGVRADLIDATIFAAQRHGISPLLMGAFMMNESGGGTSTKMGAYGMPASLNPMQIAGSSGLPKPSGPEESLEEGALLLERAVRKSGGNIPAIAEQYAGRQNVTAGYQSRLLNRLALGGATGLDNIPTDLMGVQADAQQAIMAASATSFAEMNVIIPLANDALRGFTAAVNGAAAAVNRTFRNPMPGMSYMPGAGVGIPQ